MASPVVSYRVDENTTVRFEVEPTDEWENVSADKIVGKIREAVEPAVQGAKAVLEQVKEIGPDEIQVTFGIKVSGDMNWLIAKAATDANFEICLAWKPGAAE
ncbi:MAG: CU044_2847 family protein [Actinomycetales bacterium]